MALGDVAPFHRFARFYDLGMWRADPETLGAGLACANRPVERVLDVAGGTGRAARALDVPDRIVVDAARGMLREARKHGLETVQADAATLPFADDSADAVLVVDALHHVGDVAGVFAAARRVLRPGGVLVVREFDPTTLRGRGLVAAEHLVGFDSRFWPPETLHQRLTSAGFDARVVEPGFGYTVVGVVGPVDDSADHPVDDSADGLSESPADGPVTNPADGPVVSSVDGADPDGAPGANQ